MLFKHFYLKIYYFLYLYYLTLIFFIWKTICYCCYFNPLWTELTTVYCSLGTKLTKTAQNICISRVWISRVANVDKWEWRRARWIYVDMCRTAKSKCGDGNISAHVPKGLNICWYIKIYVTEWRRLNNLFVFSFICVGCNGYRASNIPTILL